MHVRTVSALLKGFEATHVRTVSALLEGFEATPMGIDGVPWRQTRRQSNCSSSLAATAVVLLEANLRCK